MEAANGGIRSKKLSLKMSQNLQENTCARVSFLRKRLAQVFSCELWENFKNT